MPAEVTDAMVLAIREKIADMQQRERGKAASQQIDREEKTPSLGLAKILSRSQCNPPMGAETPFELVITVHLSEETRACIKDGFESIAEAIKGRGVQ